MEVRTMRSNLIILAALLTFGGSGLASAEEPLFPFVISYDSPDNVTNLSAWLPRPAGKQGFVRDRNGHLATDTGRIRFWAVNIVGGGCTPTHEQAERVAARLARLGINCIRIHHLDSGPIWGDSPNKLTIDPKQLERLDYLIYQCKLHGVYTNVNLHVSRTLGSAEGFPHSELLPMFDKAVGQFEPRMIELQKKYARDLLTHVNPYTKTAYTDEPAVAFVEISNEDGIIFEWSNGKLDALPEPYATTFRELWNGWLRKKYGSTDKLREAWGGNATPELGKELLAGGGFSRPWSEHWRVDGDEQTKVDVAVEPDTPAKGQQALRLAVKRPGQLSWMPILVHNGVSYKKGATYTLTFQIRCDTARHCPVMAQMDHEPWEELGLAASAAAGPKWRTHRWTFVADRDEPRGRVTFGRFEAGATYELAGVSLRPGGIVGWRPGQRIEDDTVPTLCRQYGTTPAGNDFCDFLRDTERTYWQEMSRFLKHGLHVRSLVCGTQLGFSTPHVQAGLDYVDNHSYWQHPQFPNQPWDMKDWYMEDIALVNRLGYTLTWLAMGRVAGKPYTVSEYNHPSPHPYLAEGLPMIASFGAFQNWDGIYMFAYSHGANFEPRRIENFFDIKNNTAQLVHQPACAAMFLRGDVAAASRPTVVRFSDEDERRELHRAHSAWDLTARELRRDQRYSLLHATALDLRDRTAGDSGQKPFVPEGDKYLAAGRFLADTGQLCWDVAQKEAGYYTVDTRRSKLFTGFVRGRTFRLGDVSLKIGPTRLDWATISMTVIDGQSFDRPGRILIAATGWVQNEGAKLEQLGHHRITLRDQWGHEPVLCEGIPASISLPVAAGRLRCYPLDESGNRRAAIAVGSDDGKGLIELAPRHKTVWYEVDIAPSE
jgi:hypothetical protein